MATPLCLLNDSRREIASCPRLTYTFTFEALLTTKMPRESKRDKTHWNIRQNDIENYWAGRQAHLKGNLDEKTRYFDKISGQGCRSYADLLLEHTEIAQALDPILHIPGLRAGFWLKMMHNVIYTRCNEVISVFLATCYFISQDFSKYSYI